MKTLKKIKSLVILAILSFSLLTANAQQDPLYSQYFNNPMLINPAFAGSMDRLFLGVAYRSQWSGVDGGPASFNFNGHIALADNKVGAGLVVVQDKIGNIKNNFYGGSASYRIKFTNSTFFFGMQVGAVQYSSNQDGLNIQNPDSRFATFTDTKFNTGVGVLLKGDRYSIGLSVPQLLANSTTVGQGSQLSEIKVYSQNYYLFGSYVFNISERIEFKPSTLLRFTSGATPAVDLNANFTFNKLYTAGLVVRNLNTTGLLLQGIMKNARLGYVFELPLKGSALNFNTHEISLALSLDVLSNHNHSSTGY
jgi:type IX secretion system PorP/SprF family membrane protein